MRISSVESPRRRRLIVEGKLVAPWVAEFATACEEAKGGLHGRALVIDLRNVTAIDPEGENVLLQLVKEKVTFHCGVFMREVLKQLARNRDCQTRHRHF